MLQRGEAPGGERHGVLTAQLGLGQRAGLAEVEIAGAVEIHRAALGSEQSDNGPCSLVERAAEDDLLGLLVDRDDAGGVLAVEACQ